MDKYTEQFLKDTKSKNLIDDRDLFFMADITCTNGNAGRVWVLFNGSDMNFCGFDGFSKAGELLETIDLTKAKVLKASSFIFHPTMKLEYQGNVYSMTGFNRAKIFIEAVEKGCNN